MKKKNIPGVRTFRLICCVITILFCIQSAGKTDDFEVKEIVCKRTKGKIVIDGRLDEPEWKDAVQIDFVKIVSLEKPNMETKAFCLYDNDYLYVGFIAYDMDIWATYKKRDSRLYEEDVMEVFIKPDLFKDSYYEFEFSPRNVILDVYLYLGKKALAGNMFFRFAQWNCQGLKSAIKIKGTLNNWEDIDEFWTGEIAIPFRSLPSIKKTPSPNDIWLFNLGRYDYSIYQKDVSEITSCSFITECDFHRYEEWCFLRFR